ncbi:DUF397 domain-containing protein [Streptomyces sp. AJS327]|uniref:DUF397 domain-containing protein n=1 Tax=Streptomyces sp. AJS327 TaxID=2545265 RepID=UPI0015DDCFFB|nr:DUF397 domain-containing protein [Streptomyces sp. AJS327]MBA0053025.1 DUF397 domain-containing protein [Streptomyces sp. AJS327]
MSDNLYSLSTDGTEFITFCGGNLQSEHETCVELALVPGTSSTYVLRDSKPEASGNELRFTAEELDTFVRGYAALRGLSI